MTWLVGGVLLCAILLVFLVGHATNQLESLGRQLSVIIRDLEKLNSAVHESGDKLDGIKLDTGDMPKVGRQRFTDSHDPLDLEP
jgi:hypothetical protein